MSRWDGLDNGDAQVPPGLYLYRIEVDEVADDAVRTAAVGVAY